MRWVDDWLRIGIDPASPAACYCQRLEWYRIIDFSFQDGGFLVPLPLGEVAAFAELRTFRPSICPWRPCSVVLCPWSLVLGVVCLLLGTGDLHLQPTGSFVTRSGKLKYDNHSVPRYMAFQNLFLLPCDNRGTGKHGLS